jgi:uncharacterized protein with NAD-binding domain and iron-sulfur cluster
MTEPSQTKPGTIEVAIIGGGCAAMATAFELSRPALRDRFHVTVYQLGWRLGGKGASGRGVGDRIEEHGLHLWMGFYENAFRLMRECYAEARRDPATCPIAEWQQAFVPDDYSAVADRSPTGQWLPWKVAFPTTPGLPGDPLPEAERWTVTHYLTRSLSLLRTLLEAAASQPSGPAAAPRSGGERRLSEIARLVGYGQLASMAALLEAMQLFEVALASLPGVAEQRAWVDSMLGLHDLVKRGLRTQIERLAAQEHELRRLWEIADLILAVVNGSLHHRLLFDPRGFDAIDDYDCREWLRLHGASEQSTNSAFVRGLYDLAFGYEDGDVTRPRIAAGQALRGALRAFFTYRGSFFWKMQAGMGDVVFAPFYDVLSARGVRFEFFHRLRNISLCEPGQLGPGGRPWVQALELDVQAEVIGGGPYRPLHDVHGLPCWPAQPDWTQLVDGANLCAEGCDFESHWEERKVGQKRLEVGRDFDLVVLGVGVGAVPHVAGELIARDARFRGMVEKCKSVATQAFQIWMRADMKELGWRDDPINISGFVEPFDTWADMRQLIPAESFPRPVRSIAYFCSVLPDPPVGSRRDGAAFRAEAYGRVRASAVDFLNRDIVHLWPEAQGADGRFRWDVLVDARVAPPPAEGEARFDSQYWTANVDPTSRYALSLPGSLQHRISPLESGFDNLTICGDYTDSGFNEGCVEAAVMSGLLAAHAVAGSPALEQIIGYDHP